MAIVGGGEQAFRSHSITTRLTRIAFVGVLLVFAAALYKVSFEQPLSTSISLSSRGPEDRPLIYLLANNPDANTTWRNMQLKKQDVVVMFNLAPPLKYFNDTPPDQLVLFMNKNWGFDPLYKDVLWDQEVAKFANAFDRVVFWENNFTRLAQDPKNQLRLAPLGHVEFFELHSRLVTRIYDTYTNLHYTGIRAPWPSTGFLAFHYAQHYFPLHDIVLVGFTGRGLGFHDFKFEHKVFEEAGARWM